MVADIQSKFNYIISYRKTWLAKQNLIAKIIGAFASIVYGNVDAIPAYRGSEVEEGIKIMRRESLNFHPCIKGF
ncbi:hypothetical protein Ahy_B01g052762 isoform A [Arachis hypogaea]|uniref:Uncharacterized protein n=1 Tax=Arachis hypogaea TaxID=3818 RepID=A0A445AQA0_ARAHY|nr:hypothetical protein Ahy_B01g052762 isoform A [Arachis hypogaea]